MPWWRRKGGHNLGRVFYEGEAEANTGTPGNIAGYSSERIVRAPAAGVITNIADIGDSVSEGQVIAHVDGVPVVSPLSGMLRGLIQTGIRVDAQMKIGDVDPRNKAEFCYSISDKSRSIAGGVLEALLHLKQKLGEAVTPENMG